jgi:hypothetical protein
VKQEQHASVPLRRVRAGELRWEELLYEPTSGPAMTRRSPGYRLTLQPGGARALTSVPVRARLGARFKGIAAVNPGHLWPPSARRFTCANAVGLDPARRHAVCMQESEGLGPVGVHSIARNARKARTDEASQLRRMHYSPPTDKQVVSPRHGRARGGSAWTAERLSAQPITSVSMRWAIQGAALHDRPRSDGRARYRCGSRPSSTELHPDANREEGACMLRRLCVPFL